jgi:hypothetical protein
MASQYYDIAMPPFPNFSEYREHRQL